MEWRNQIRDVAILSSLSDDLKLFWQLKATRWEKLEARVRQTAEQTSGYNRADEEEVAAKFKKVLLGDSEYKELRYRIRTASKEAREIASFLGLKTPEGIEELTFKPPLMSYEAIETVIDALDHFITLVRVSSYSYHYVLQAMRSPISFGKALWQNYYG